MSRFWVCVEVGRSAAREDDVYVTVDAADWNQAGKEAERKVRTRAEYENWRTIRAVEIALRE